MAIHPAAAVPNDWPARLYPVGSNALLSTRFDFSCISWEPGLVERLREG